MAGYFIDGCHLDDTPEEFVHAVSFGDGAQRVIKDLTQSRVLTLQVDGDELDAVLWGLEHYKKLRIKARYLFLNGGYRTMYAAFISTDFRDENKVVVAVSTLTASTDPSEGSLTFETEAEAIAWADTTKVRIDNFNYFYTVAVLPVGEAPMWNLDGTCTSISIDKGIELQKIDLAVLSEEPGPF